MSQEERKVKIYRFFGWSILAATLLVLAGFCLYGAAGRDDAHITYWPAYTLAHMGDILNYNGEMVEQSSSLLQVVLLAVSHMVSGVNIVTLGHLMSIFFGAASLPLTYLFARRLHPEAGPLAALVTAVYGSFVYWSFGGLESTLAAFCVLWVLLVFDNILTTSKSSVWEWGYTLLATLALLAVRPEMPVVLACILLGTASAMIWRGVRSGTWTRLGYLALLSTLVAIALFTWRYFTFGYLFPLSVSAKSGVSMDRAYHGFQYLYSLARYPSSLRFGLTPMGLFGGISVAASVSYLYRRFSASNTEFRTYLEFLGGSFALAYISFIVLTGGDWMEAGRFTVPLVPVASAFISAEIYTYFQSRQTQWALSGGIVAIALASAVNVSLSMSTGIPITSRASFEDQHVEFVDNRNYFSFFELYNRVHFRDVLLLEKVHDALEKIEGSKSSKVYILSAFAGFTPFHLSKLEFGKFEYIDQFSLTTTQLTECDSIVSKNIRQIEGKYFSFEDIMDNENIDRCGYDVDIIFTSPNAELENLGFREVHVNHSKKTDYGIGRMSVYVRNEYYNLFEQTN